MFTFVICSFLRLNLSFSVAIVLILNQSLICLFVSERRISLNSVQRLWRFRIDDFCVSFKRLFWLDSSLPNLFVHFLRNLSVCCLHGPVCWTWGIKVETSKIRHSRLIMRVTNYVERLKDFQSSLTLLNIQLSGSLFLLLLVNCKNSLVNFIDAEL